MTISGLSDSQKLVSPEEPELNDFESDLAYFTMCKNETGPVFCSITPGLLDDSS